MPVEASRGKLSGPTVKTTKTTAKQKKSAASKKASGKRAAKRLRGVRTPALLGTPPKLPIEQPLPPDILEYLAKGDITHAARGLLMEPATEKLLYLLREAQRIGEAPLRPKLVKADAHRHYLNLGVANHNLFLFVKRHGTTNTPYIKEALACYTKARKASAKEERAELDLLRAALLASSGKPKEAQRIFRKVSTDEMQANHHTATFLATYYAAMHDAPNVVVALKRAYALNPTATKGWLRVTDDFAALKENTELQALFTEWDVFGTVQKAKKK